MKTYRSLSEALASDDPVSLLRQDPGGWCYFDREEFCRLSENLRSDSPEMAEQLIKIGDDWLGYRYHHESGGISELDPRGPLWQSVQRMKFLAYLSWASQLSGNPKYLDFAIEQFNSFYEQVGDWNMRTEKGKRALLKGPGVGKMLEFLSIFYSSLEKEKTDDMFLEKLAFTLIHYADLVISYETNLLFSNVPFFNSLGSLSVSFAIPCWQKGLKARQSIIDYLFECIRNQFRTDGFHCEQNVNYARAVLRSCSKLFHLLRKQGHQVPADIIATHHQAGLSLYQFQDGLGHVLDFGDTGMATNFDWAVAWWNLGLPDELKYTLSTPDHFSWCILGLSGQHSSESTKRRLKLESKLLRESGYAFMRPTDNSSNTVLAFDCGPHGHYHGHYDLLSIILRSEGRALLPDPGVYKYDSSPQRMAAMSTFYHSTLCLDTQNHGAWEDDEKPLGGISNWQQTEKVIQVTGWHDGYAHLTGSPRLVRQIWYDRDRTWVILDRVFCRTHERRSRLFAFSTVFNLPDARHFELSTDLSSLRTTFEQGPNLLISIHAPVTMKRISLLPGMRNAGRKGSEETKRLCLTTNTFSCCHLTVLSLFKTTPPSVMIAADTLEPEKAASLVLTCNGRTHSIRFETPITNTDTKGLLL